jgi:putative nucleotidyltransferase with HDIG domain
MTMMRKPGRQLITVIIAVVGCIGAGAWAVASSTDPSLVFHPLTFLLALFGLLSNLYSAKWSDSLEISGSHVAVLVAAAFIGPLAAFVVVIIAEGVAWAIERLSPRALPLNIASVGIPAVAAAVAMRAVAPEGPDEGGVFYLAFGVITLAAAALNLLLFYGGLLLEGESLGTRRTFLREMLPVWGINIVLTVAIASVYAEAGLSAAALLLAGILAFTYQLRLVQKADDRTRQYASLSWGVLSGMVRNLDMRDGRTARHCAAVAQFARDIAAAAGLSARDQELAHTAGLLHDVGKFALSDRVMERAVNLNETDWKGIRRHPELGAAMLRDVGVYGPIAEIVRTHHERLDGRGYPAGLKGDEIPEVAKIVAVAEVYDTLTSEDTYRARMSSFEALTELRRVSGRQLEGRYVEALAQVLQGTGMDYRHAGTADFDRELDVERRIGEAVGAEGAGS